MEREAVMSSGFESGLARGELVNSSSSSEAFGLADHDQ
jgi:hypothetical protein